MKLYLVHELTGMSTLIRKLNLLEILAEILGHLDHLDLLQSSAVHALFLPLPRVSLTHILPSFVID